MIKVRLANSDVDALVDDEDSWVLGHRWYLQRSPNPSRHGYPWRGRGNTKFYMHREIMRCPSGLLVDHINGNSIDNRRSNLRIVTRSQNAANRHRVSSNTGIKGVTYWAKQQKWHAYIGQESIGLFESPEEAAAAYDAKAVERYGEYAATNASGLLVPGKRRTSFLGKQTGNSNSDNIEDTG